MKLAAYFEGKELQLVMTPEDDSEKAIMGLLGHDTKNLQVQAFVGGFYHCKGGWTRQEINRDSLIILVHEDT